MDAETRHRSHSRGSLMSVRAFVATEAYFAVRSLQVSGLVFG